MLSAGRSVGTNAATTSQTSTDKVSALSKGDDVAMIMSMSMMILTMMRIMSMMTERDGWPHQNG